MPQNTEPSDKYRCIKVPLKNILRDDTCKVYQYKELKKLEKKIGKKNDNIKSTHSIIFDTVIRTNKIMIKTYLLLRLWILDKYHNNDIIPKITIELISSCMQSLKIN